MTYDAKELSDQDGQPVRLYEFRRGQAVYRYTSADTNITWNAQVWETRSGGVTDDGIRQSGPAEEDLVVISCAWDNEIAVMFRGTPPSDQVAITIRRLHITDIDAEASVIWVGLVGSLRQPRIGFAELVCQSALNGFQNAGLRLAYSRSCPHMLYDSQCRVPKASFAVAATVTSATGVDIGVSGVGAFADGWFSGGFVEWEIDMLGTIERRAIDTHTGSVLSMLNSVDGLTVALGITLYPGCFRNVTTCKTKFNNLPNYGGFPHLPGIDPFQLGALFGQTGSGGGSSNSDFENVLLTGEGKTGSGGSDPPLIPTENGLTEDTSSPTYDPGYIGGEGGG